MLLFFAITGYICLVATPLQASIGWTCPYCDQSYIFDPLQADYAQDMYEQHVTLCPSRPGAGFSFDGPAVIFEDRSHQVTSELFNEYRTLVSDLMDAYQPFILSGLPHGRRPGSLADMGKLAADLNAFCGSKVALLDEYNRDWQAYIDKLTDRNLQTIIRATALQQKTAELEKNIERLEQTLKRESLLGPKLKAQTVKLDRLAGRLRDDYSSSKEALYERLAEAFDAGIIHSPSAYASAPSPSTPVFQYSEGAARADRPRIAPGTASVQLRRDPVARVSSGTIDRPIASDEQGVRAQLEQTRGFRSKLRAGVRQHLKLRSQAREIESEAKETSELMRRLTVAREEKVTRWGDLDRKLMWLRFDNCSLSYKRDDAVGEVCRQAGAWAFWHTYDDITKDLLDKIPGMNVRSEMLLRFRKVMEGVGKLGRDITGFLPQAADDALFLRDTGLSERIDEVLYGFEVQTTIEATGTSPPFLDLLQKIRDAAKKEQE